MHTDKAGDVASGQPTEGDEGMSRTVLFGSRALSSSRIGTKDGSELDAVERCCTRKRDESRPSVEFAERLLDALGRG